MCNVVCTSYVRLKFSVLAEMNKCVFRVNQSQTDPYWAPTLSQPNRSYYCTLNWRFKCSEAGKMCASSFPRASFRLSGTGYLSFVYPPRFLVHRADRQLPPQVASLCRVLHARRRMLSALTPYLLGIQYCTLFIRSNDMGSEHVAEFHNGRSACSGSGLPHVP